MKKILALIMATAMCLSFAACGSGEKEKASTKTSVENAEEKKSAKMKKGKVLDDGMLLFIVIDDKVGYINSAGEIVIEPQFEIGSVGYCSDGMIPAYIDGKKGYLDESGKFAFELPETVSSNSGFTEGLAVAIVDGKWGYIDKTGEFVIEPQFDYAQDFKEGCAAVQVDDKYGYIGKTGKFVIEPQFLDAYSFENGVARVVDFEAREYYIDADGNEVDVPDVEDVLISTMSGNLYGFTDATGAFVIEPQFDNARDFSEGLAAVCVEGKWGYIDESGEFVIEPQFTGYPDDFRNGHAVVTWSKDKKGSYEYGVVLKDGTIYRGSDYEK